MAVAASYLQRGGGRKPVRLGAGIVPARTRIRRLGRVTRPRPHRSRGAGRSLLRPRAQFASVLGAQPGVEILNEIVLNQVLVRFRDDETTREVVRRVQEDGTCWLGATDWQRRAAMRISVSSFRTTAQDVERSAEAILNAFKNLQGEPIEERWAPSG